MFGTKTKPQLPSIDSHPKVRTAAEQLRTARHRASVLAEERQRPKRAPEEIQSELDAADEDRRLAEQAVRLAQDEARRELVDAAQPRIADLLERARAVVSKLDPLAEEAKALLTELRAAGLSDAHPATGGPRKVLAILSAARARDL